MQGWGVQATLPCHGRKGPTNRTQKERTFQESENSAQAEHCLNALYNECHSLHVSPGFFRFFSAICDWIFSTTHSLPRQIYGLNIYALRFSRKGVMQERKKWLSWYWPKPEFVSLRSSHVLINNTRSFTYGFDIPERKETKVRKHSFIIGLGQNSFAYAKYTCLWNACVRACQCVCVCVPVCVWVFRGACFHLNRLV